MLDSSDLPRIRAQIDMYEQCVKIRYRGRSGKTNIKYERNDRPDSEDEFTSDSEYEFSSSEDENNDEIVLTLSDACEKSVRPSISRSSFDEEPRTNSSRPREMIISAQTRYSPDSWTL